MFSWTIDGIERRAPMGYGEITISQYATYQRIIAPLAPDYKPKQFQSKSKGIIGKITNMLIRAKNKIDESNVDQLDRHERQFIFESAFVSHWLKLDDIVEQMAESDIRSIYLFLNQQWQAWEPKQGIESFTYDRRLWKIDYSLDTLGSIKDIGDLQSVMAAICYTGSTRKSARYWGGLSLDIAASIMEEIKIRHAQIGDIVGYSILESFKLN